MKQNLFITGSILSACILILVSFSSVVSINTIEETNIPTSPLFDSRISTAIQSDSTTSISTSYIGKDAINDMWFPKATHTGLLLQKVHSIVKDLRNYLKNIDNVHSLSYNEIVSLMVSYLKNQEMFSNVNEGYLHNILFKYLDSTQQSVMDEFSDSVVDFTVYAGCWLDFLSLLFVALFSITLYIYLKLSTVAYCISL